MASTTYILPDLPWAILLGPIRHDARPGDVIVVSTTAMRAHVEQVAQAAGRDDLVIRHVEPPHPCRSPEPAPVKKPRSTGTRRT